jgi:hypothetical protein
MRKILVLWDEFGGQASADAYRAYLIMPESVAQRDRLMSMHNMFVNSSKTPVGHPVNRFSDAVYADNPQLERWRVKLPLKIDESVIIIRAGFLP